MNNTEPIPEPYGRYHGKRLLGPCDLEEALELATVSSKGTAVAVSVPNGDWVAIRHADGTTEHLKLPVISGRGGSIENTGDWHSLPLVNSWRPG